jgi:molybdenum cofactor cytidylyltransferase
MKFSSLILAAGKSERMGTLKLLLPWRGRTILAEVVSQVLESGVSQALVVLGYAAAEQQAVLADIRDDRLQVVLNPQYELGMLSSVQAGLRQLSPATEAVLLSLGDQPRLLATVYRRVMECYIDSGQGILIPSYLGKRGHPIVIHARFVPYLLNLNPITESLHSLTSAYREQIMDLPLDEPAVLQDVDRPEDYQHLLQEEQA